jgi:S-methylmethionine-dependent homocysteine/selenocysteine methylase
MDVTILDGPVGTQLAERGVPTPLPGWSAHAVDEHPDAVREIHAAYARAGAQIHTACTFRTTRRAIGDDWARLARDAVRLAYEGPREGATVDAVGVGGPCQGSHAPLIAGSIAPLQDCYRPDLSPAATDPDAAREEHAALARVLVDAGVDLLLVETFGHVGECLIGVEQAVRAGQKAERAIPVWAALTPGFRCDLLTPSELAAGAKRAIEAGAAAVLVNCVPAARAIDYVRALADVAQGMPVGVYANAGRAEDTMGWTSEPIAAQRYADLAATWIDAGATIVGGCCGTGPGHVEELARRFASG